VFDQVTRVSVEWNITEPAPTTIRKIQMMSIPRVTLFLYERNRWIMMGGMMKNGAFEILKIQLRLVRGGEFIKIISVENY
jgi:hypothetical protein